MLSTARVAVCSAAIATPAENRTAATATSGEVFIDDLLRSGIEEKASGVRKAERQNGQGGRYPPRDLGDPVGRRAGAVGARDAFGRLRLAIDRVVATAKAGESDADENRLVGLERGQVANPGAAHTGEKERERDDAAGSGCEGAQDPAKRQKHFPGDMTLHGRVRPALLGPRLVSNRHCFR